MRRAAAVLMTVLVLAAHSSALSDATESDGAAREREAARIALALADQVGAYTALHPLSPGAMRAFDAPDVRVTQSVLVHSYPELEPSYFFVLLESSKGTASVTTDASARQWHAYQEIPLGSCGTFVSRLEAAEAAREAGAEVPDPEALVVIEVGRSLWWHIPEGSSGISISTTDPTDVRFSPPTSGHTLHPAEGTHRETGSGGGLPERPARHRVPESYDISGVPFHYQVTNYFCGPASLEMVFDYWGPDVDQYDISYVADSDEVLLSTARDNLRRAAHFSSMSTAIQDSTLIGYDERSLGYSSLEQQWSYEPDYSTRYTDLKRLISADYPVLLLMWYSEAHQAGHYRVVKGYDDATDVFIAHDPWYTDPYQGPDVHFNQAFFVDDLWTRSSRWGLLVAPWTSTIHPWQLVANDTTLVTVVVEYRAPDPYAGDYVATGCSVTLSLPASLSLAPGETATKPLSGLGASGSFDTASWRVVAGPASAGLEASLDAVGVVSGSSSSYPAYSDSIGGISVVTLDVIESSPTLILVDHAGGGDCETIQEGLFSADDGDTVLVSAGVYSGPLNRNISFGGRNVLLLSEDGADSTIVDCGGVGRGFVFETGEGAGAIVDGFTVTGAVSPANFGGGIVCTEAASPTIRNCVVSDCSASFFGGGVYCDGGSSPSLQSVVLCGNSSVVGSGLYCREGAAPVVSNCTIAANSSSQVTASDAFPSIWNSIIASSVNGYGITCQGSADAEISHCCVFGNAQGDSLCGSYHDNIFLDPLFCNLEAFALTLHEDSPCLPENNSWGELVGALGDGGCGPSTGVAGPVSPHLVLSYPDPNPLVDQTLLELTTSTGGHASVFLYNVCGQRVRTLLDATVQAGTVQVTWDGTDASGTRVAAGIYFCSAAVGDLSATRKMVLLR